MSKSWMKRLLLASSLGVALLGFAGTAEAAPRDDIRAAYDQALAAFNELELDQAESILDQAISAAQSSGAGDDPSLASLHMMKAALIYTNQGDGGSSAIVSELEKAARLNYFVVVPLEVRSEGMSGYLEQARQRVGAAPTEAILHTPPTGACDGDLVFEALLGVPDGGQAALYWRKQGDTAEPVGEAMDVFSNVATVTIPAAGHENAIIEYFIFAFDQNSQPVANLGLEEAPLVLDQKCAAGEETPPPGDGDGDGDVAGDGDKGPDKPQDTLLPRVWIGLGVGTGVGLALGEAEKTYEQYFPRNLDFTYGLPQKACAIARFWAGDGPLPATSELFGANASDPDNGTAFAVYGGDDAANLGNAYNPRECEKRHPVSPGLAPALLHITPEIQVRVSKRITLSAFGRLQLVTGAQVFRDDPTKPPGDPNNQQSGTTYWDDVYTASPASNFSDGELFAFAGGVKFKYFLLDDMSKFRLFVGAFAGGGLARLRVDMGFANDRNGNSVPDDREQWADAPFDPVTGNYDEANCVSVWPYNTAGCSEDPSNPDYNLANNTRLQADTASRIDTVRLGPVFGGALFGFHYQVVKNFAFYGEIDLGAWFPSAASFLIDLTIGPMVSF